MENVEPPWSPYRQFALVEMKVLLVPGSYRKLSILKARREILNLHWITPAPC